LNELEMLREHGYTGRLEEDFRALDAAGTVPARVVGAIRRRYRLLLPGGEVVAGVPAGRLRHRAAPGELPVVGDWVAATPNQGGGPATVAAVLPRRGALTRGAPGTGGELQLLATHVDVVYVVVACGQDFNDRRLERYLAVCREAGAEPVVVVTKVDLVPDPGAYLARAGAVSPGVVVRGVCAPEGEGVEELRAFLCAPRTGAVVGSSGAGKSTLVNALLGEARQDTGAVRVADQRGRHTTTRRDLLPLPGGAWLVDTPGMRELALPGDDGGVAEAFADVEELMGACRFRDCRHAGDQGCAVEEALVEGDLDPGRWASYGKLQREATGAAARRQARARRREGRRRRRLLR
jgi:ribosome biogenesis GTPase